jgi:hypothetical protein
MKKYFAGIAALALAIGMMLAACDNGTTTTTPETYTGGSSGSVYILVITGDTYELTITDSTGTHKSTGTVTSNSGGAIVLQPQSGNPINVATTGSGGISGITVPSGGGIADENGGSSVTPPGTTTPGGAGTPGGGDGTGSGTPGGDEGAGDGLTPGGGEGAGDGLTPGGDGGDPFAGTWMGPNETTKITASNGTWTQALYYSILPGIVPGTWIDYVHATYTVQGNLITSTIIEANTVFDTPPVDQWVPYDDLNAAYQERLGGKTAAATVTGDTFASDTSHDAAVYTRVTEGGETPGTSNDPLEGTWERSFGAPLITFAAVNTGTNEGTFTEYYGPERIEYVRGTYSHIPSVAGGYPLTRCLVVEANPFALGGVDTWVPVTSLTTDQRYSVGISNGSFNINLTSDTSFNGISSSIMGGFTKISDNPDNPNAPDIPGQYTGLSLRGRR